MDKDQFLDLLVSNSSKTIDVDPPLSNLRPREVDESYAMRHGLFSGLEKRDERCGK